MTALTPNERKRRSRDRLRVQTIEVTPEALAAIRALRAEGDTSLGATVTRLVLKLAEEQAQ